MNDPMKEKFIRVMSEEHPAEKHLEKMYELICQIIRFKCARMISRASEPIQFILQEKKSDDSNQLKRPTTNSQEAQMEEEAGESWKPEVGEEYWVAYYDGTASWWTWTNTPKENEWYYNDCIRKTEAEALERSRELNREREILVLKESPDYRYLEEGEIIQPGDEVLKDDREWMRTSVPGTVAPNPNYASNRLYRRNLQREAAETESPETGKDGNKSCPISCSPSDWKIGGKCDKNGCYHESETKPAPPLREMPKVLDFFWCVDFYQCMGGEIKFDIARMQWSEHSFCLGIFQAGLLFPDSEAGRLGAERRAKMGIIPPIDREELEQKLDEWINGDITDLRTATSFITYLESILEGGQTS